MAGKQPSVPKQEFDFRNTTNVSKAMIKAGTLGRSRIRAGMRAAWNAKVSSMYGEDTTMGAKGLRFFGMTEAAKWYDRFLAKEKKTKTGGSGATGGSASAGTRQVSGEIRGINRKLDILYAVTMDTNKGISDIKSLLMPKGVVARSKDGQTKFVQFNPLAPQGEQFNTVTESGKLTSIPPGRAFQASAQKKAALATAQLALKILEEDKKKQQYKWKDKKEEFRKKDPIGVLSEKVDRLTEKVDALGKDKKSGLLGTLTTLITGLIGGMLGTIRKLISPLFRILGPIARAIGSVARWTGRFTSFVAKSIWGFVRAIGSGIGSLLGKFGFTVPGILAGGAAVATTAAMGLALDKGMKQGADKAIDGVMTDVTKRIKNSGFTYSDEQKYKLYKADMDKAYESEQDPNRKAYKKQQWLMSEGLSDEEKAMARRYFHEKEGGSKGPRSRGGPRNRPQTIPAEIMAEGSDTVDTNYADVPVTPPKTGSLQVQNQDYLGRLRQLGDIIASGESNGDYNIYNKGTVGSNKGKIGRADLSNMTIAEYLRRGSLGPNDPQKMFAVGKYQIIPNTMRDAIKKLGLDPNTTYLTPETQERIFKDYLIEGKPAVKRWLRGESDDKNAAILALAKEWASVGVPEDVMRGDKLIKAGQSYYKGIGGNRAHTSAERISSIVPVPSSTGSTIDSANRELMALNSPTAGAPVVATTVYSNQTNNNVGKRPMAKADVVTRDEALVRTANRTSRHPVHG